CQVAVPEHLPLLLGPSAHCSLRPAAAAAATSASIHPESAQSIGAADHVVSRGLSSKSRRSFACRLRPRGSEGDLPSRRLIADLSTPWGGEAKEAEATDAETSSAGERCCAARRSLDPCFRTDGRTAYVCGLPRWRRGKPSEATCWRSAKSFARRRSIACRAAARSPGIVRHRIFVEPVQVLLDPREVVCKLRPHVNSLVVRDAVAQPKFVTGDLPSWCARAEPRSSTLEGHRFPFKWGVVVEPRTGHVRLLLHERVDHHGTLPLVDCDAGLVQHGDIDTMAVGQVLSQRRWGCVQQFISIDARHLIEHRFVSRSNPPPEVMRNEQSV